MNTEKYGCIAILGDRDTGKTNLAFNMLYEYRKSGGTRKIYTLGYPAQTEYTNINNIREIMSLRNAIVFIDEIQTFIKVYDRKANSDLMELISKCSHRKITIIFTTQLTQFITKGVEAFIDAWCFTKINDLGDFKNGSKPKRIIQQTALPQCSQWALSLEKGEYLLYSDKNQLGENKIYNFTNMNIKKDW